MGTQSTWERRRHAGGVRSWRGEVKVEVEGSMLAAAAANGASLLSGGVTSTTNSYLEKLLAEKPLTPC